MEDRNGWPRTVNTFADMQNFVQMMSGCPKEVQTDLSGHLPEPVSVGGKQADGVPMLSRAGTGTDPRLGSRQRRCFATPTLTWSISALRTSANLPSNVAES